MRGGDRVGVGGEMGGGRGRTGGEGIAVVLICTASNNYVENCIIQELYLLTLYPAHGLIAKC